MSGGKNSPTFLETVFEAGSGKEKVAKNPTEENILKQGRTRKNFEARGSLSTPSRRSPTPPREAKKPDHSSPD